MDLPGSRVRNDGVKRVSLGVMALVAAAATGGQAHGVSGRCAQALPRGAQVPAPIVVTTRCGRFRLQPKGAVVFKGARTLPVPKGANYWMDLTWYRFSRHHLLIGRGLKQLWRSHGTYSSTYPYDVGRVVLGARELSFSYSGRLYVARYGGPEHMVARGESPIAFLSGRLLTWRTRGWALVLRGAGRVVVPHAVDPQWDRASGMVVFRTGRRLRAFDGVKVRELGNRFDLGVRGNPVVELLGGLVSMHDTRRLVVLDYDGRLVASAPLPARPKRADGVSSAVVANSDRTAFAFTATKGNTAYGSHGSESVYVLPAGGHAVKAVFTENLQLNECERTAWLAWHGHSLLYANTELRGAVVDGSGHAAAVDLTHVIARLPGAQRDGPFEIAWAPAP
jgi:hypothetical protein